MTGYGKTDHFAHNFKIALLVFKGSVDLNEEAGYKRMVNWPIFRDSFALGNGDNY